METFGDLFQGDCAAEMAGILRDDAAAHPTPELFVSHLGAVYSQELLGVAVMVMATWVEPHDSHGPIDPEHEASTAFLKGGLLGVHLADVYLGRPNLTRVLSDVPSFIPEPSNRPDEDNLQVMHLRGAVLCRYGEEGFDRAAVYQELVETWLDDLCADARYQPYVKRGFGFVMNLMDRLLAVDAERATDAFRAEIESFGDDWDALFSDELSKAQPGE